MNLKLSIITINRNNAAGLEKTCVSVVNQTFKDFEWIVIDGASTDNSVEIIKKYSDKITYWVSEPDAGIYDAMNKGIEKANGQYCWFLNSGDYAYADTTLEKIFKHKFNEDFVYGDIIFVKDGVSNKYPYTYLSRPKNPVFWKLAHIPHQATFTKKEVFNKFGKYDTNYKILADMAFIIKAVFVHKASVKHINVIYAVFIKEGITENPSFNDVFLAEAKKYKNEYLPKNKIYLFFCVLCLFPIRCIWSLKYGKISKLFKKIFDGKH